MSFSLLIAKKEGEKTFPYYYRLGWLVEGKNKKFHWPELGRVNTLENAIKAAKNMFPGKTKVYLSDKPLSDTITEEELVYMREIVD